MNQLWIICCLCFGIAVAFPPSPLQYRPIRALTAAQGFGAGGAAKKQKASKKGKRLSDALEDKPTKPSSSSASKPFIRSESDDLIAALQAQTASSCLGQAVANSPLAGTPDADPFWELMPSLIASRFPKAKDEELQRIAGFIRHTLDPNLPLEDEFVRDPYRRHDEMHAYLPGLGSSQPFLDPSQLELCRQLSENYETVKSEYDALIDDMKNGGKDRFQSVTSMNYESGWKTLVLFYNGHRIKDFPYHLCPTTTKILETVPLAGRIAGFNRQQPQSGIPLHTDGNNMWLTCQMGIYVPEGEKAHIRVGPETRHWKRGECLLYDTTYEHETFNAHPEQERVVLHVDFFNTLALTPLEIEIMQYIYELREEFMRAEGVAKVGAQIL
uniref:Aspartyl/asparaginy/proline hydroxylase domain-containing protein n=1 Tax=Amphora coffeiformis TaxID=265554 RepID=A0A7S3P8A6_9STRA|mmetsp:Transcript_18135/g.34411  ORF Transcript_18135/g.34411 Transcript_18135/m.34411 type:complete len:384 (-) Transcript_18135:426-1577(-)|eukprot:scaffold36418_cov191-Amphora_coffeaeformis.AAC.7